MSTRLELCALTYLRDGVGNIKQITVCNEGPLYQMGTWDMRQNFSSVLQEVKMKSTFVLFAKLKNLKKHDSVSF